MEQIDIQIERGSEWFDSAARVLGWTETVTNIIPQGEERPNPVSQLDFVKGYVKGEIENKMRDLDKAIAAKQIETSEVIGLTIK